MTNEWKEFRAYTEPVSYTATGKLDTSYLGRMTFETITEYVGMARILTILARGYLYHNDDGSLRDGDPYARIEYARNALCAWCSVPDKEKESEPTVDFGFLSKVFPELINENGEGWYWRHVKNVIRFVRKHPEITSVNAQKACDKISRSFIVIAHRLSTIRSCDEIIVMEHGEIKDRGTHKELMENSSVYRDLVTAE